MAIFPLKKRTFFYPVYSTPNLKMFPLHCIPEILYAESIDTELIIRAKSFFSMTQHLSTIHPLRTDGWTDKRQTTIVPSTPTAYTVAVIKKRSKIVYSIGLIINVRERKFLGTNVPTNESSTYGTLVPGNESSRVRKFQLPWWWRSLWW